MTWYTFGTTLQLDTLYNLRKMKIHMHFIIFITVYAVMVACKDIRLRWLDSKKGSTLLHAKMHVSSDKVIAFLKVVALLMCPSTQVHLEAD